jgi:hypothetical protein
MIQAYTYKYDFDNFDEPFRFKIKLKNGSKFRFLNNYYEYYFYPKDNEQALRSYCLLDTKEEAKKSIEFSNNVLQYIIMAPILQKDVSIRKKEINRVILCDEANISTKNISILKYVSEKILKFKVEYDLFNEVINLNHVALSNLIMHRKEDSILYYFKIIEKLSKKNYVKFHERNYTKKVKQNNKNKLRSFLENYFNENLKVDMTEGILSTAIEEIYKKLRREAYSSIYLKISFFCNCKSIPVNLESLSELVKTRNKLAHGDTVENEVLDNALSTAFLLSREFISIYFFNKKYSEISIHAEIYEVY